ncbi:MAG: hypothetical protein K6G26_02590 [Lachnospiraceae bacterium]|nr:hypothetical protein [Lachnospiraceae bacterium]
MKKLSFKERLLYWFDNKMSQGSLGLIKLLSVVTVIAALLFATILHYCGIRAGEEDAFGLELWDSFSTILNAWFPSYEDGWTGYRVMMTFCAVFGLLITSTLIGIISTAIMEKMDSLKKSDLAVLEKDHIVVLGFKSGEYTLIQELVNGADKRPCCIVIASDLDRETMEESIRSNVTFPKNVRIHCRNINIFNPQELERCSISTCKTVLVSPADNDSTIRTLVAVTRILHEVNDKKITTIAVLSEDEERFPKALCEKYNIILLHTSETIARVIAHSCTQPGLSQTILEMFHFEGSEMHLVSLPEMQGMTFEELLCCIDDASPVGICKGKEMHINPGGDMVFEKDDSLLVFCEESDSTKIVKKQELQPLENLPVYEGAIETGDVVIIGCNEFLPTIVFELPENVPNVILADVDKCFRDEIIESAKRRETPINVTFFENDVENLEEMEKLAAMGAHFILLTSHENSDSSDLQNIFRIMTLRDIKERNKLKFNISMELRQEINENLLIPDISTEFVVSSHMSSLFLAQLSESPELLGAFDELLTNEGNEIYLKTAKELNCEGQWTVREIRRRILPQGYVMIGYMKSETMKSDYNMKLDKSITFESEDMLIVIGEN